MTTQLPYCDIFPHLHPLDKKMTSLCARRKFKLPEKLKIPLQNHYRHVLTNKYLTSDKITDVIGFLGHFCKQKTLIEQTKHFVNSQYIEYDKEINLHFKNIYYFWVYSVCAFVFINQYISNPTEQNMTYIMQAFERANLFKKIYFAKRGIKKGGRVRADKYKQANFKAYKIWSKFSNQTKRKTNRSVHELDNRFDEWKTDLKNKLSQRTLESWVREWKRRTFASTV